MHQLCGVFVRKVISSNVYTEIRNEWLLGLFGHKTQLSVFRGQCDLISVRGFFTLGPNKRDEWKPRWAQFMGLYYYCVTMGEPFLLCTTTTTSTFWGFICFGLSPPPPPPPPSSPPHPFFSLNSILIIWLNCFS